MNHSTKNLIRLVIILLVVVSACTDENSLNPDSDTVIKNVVNTNLWNCNEKSKQLGNSTYTVTIERNTSVLDGIVIYNFYKLGNTAKAYASISGLNISFSEQDILSYKLLSGSGTISSDMKQIKLNYSMDDGSGDYDLVTATLTPKY
jgi:hypothetical protein